MSHNPYPAEELDSYEDDGTMPDNVAELAEHVVGHRIVEVVRDAVIPPKYPAYSWSHPTKGTALVLDNGKKVMLEGTGDCCAYTELEDIIFNLDKIDHVITGVGTTDGYTRWHIYADLGDVVELQVGWSGGNVGYYGYGFDITVQEES